MTDCGLNQEELKMLAMDRLEARHAVDAFAS